LDWEAATALMPLQRGQSEKERVSWEPSLAFVRFWRGWSQNRTRQVRYPIIDCGIFALFLQVCRSGTPLALGAPSAGGENETGDRTVGYCGGIESARRARNDRERHLPADPASEWSGGSGSGHRRRSYP